MAEAIVERKGRAGTLRRGLMLYGSTAALAAALMLAEGGIGPAFAQAIGPRITPNVSAQGDFTVPGASPSPTFEYRSGNLDIVHMNRDAVLNWTTYDAAPPGGAQGNSYVNFLPEGTELRFVGNGESFTAINRVFTTPDNSGAYRGIAIQGQVTSYLFGDGPGFVGPVGGNIWFYSPGGILATGSASFNVGSLLLSASDLDNFNDQGFAHSVEFTGVANPFASVILQSGARVTLTQPNSNFTIVAPTIEQGGDVSVNGSALYLSAEQGILYFYNDGQSFSSINVDAQPGNQVRHVGTTTGPASLSTDDFAVYDPQTIEFRTGRDVGVLLSGSIGYAPATDAALGPNGSIVLTVGQVSTTGDLNLTSNTMIEARAVNLSAEAGESLTLGSDASGPLSLRVAAPNAALTAGAGGVIDIAGDLTLETDSEAAIFRVSAADAGANQPGGRIAVGGDLSLESSYTNFGGGSQQGGDIEVTIGDGGSIAVGGALTLSSNGYAVEDDNGTSARGGRAVLSMTGASASLAVGGNLTLSAQGLPFPNNCECYPPPGGLATGGYAALTATGGTIEAGHLNVSASAEAFGSFYTEQGATLDATGGTALVALGDSTANLLSVSISAEAHGANASSGADGGAGFGGTASFSKGPGGSLATQGIVVSADASGGEGSGSDGETFSTSRGGNAEGGTASVSLAQNAQGLGYLDLSARAQAGTGGSAIEVSAASGADGGDAIGGTAMLTLSGAGTNLDGVEEGSLNVASFGGDGGRGEADYNNGIQSGDGGDGGGSIGGSLLITAADGAEFSWSGSFGLSSIGGSGGRGGDEVITDFGASGIGRGGRGGDALGAAVTLVANGGLIAGGLEVFAEALSGDGGLDGFDQNGNYTGNGDHGTASGGSIDLIARDNGASRFDVGYAALYASGDVAGLIAVTDETTDAGASMRFGSLYAEAYGDAADATPSIRLSAVSNAVVVDGTAELYGNAIALDFTGSGRLEVGGFALLSSSGGDVTITHTSNPGVLSLHSNGPTEIYANGDYVAAAGSVAASGDYALIRATGSISAHDTRSLSGITMTAQGDVTVANASSGGDFDLFAGRLEGDGSHAYQPSARAMITGTIAAGGSVSVESGGFAEFTSGSSVLSDNDITVRTGDDIIVASGASLVSDINPYDDVTLSLLAGDINFGFSDGDLVEPIASPIASLVIAGSLDTNGASLYLTGDAINASNSSIATGNLYVDVTDAPLFGPYSNDAGLLPAGCAQGSACLGSVTATRDVAIGLNSNNGLISLRTGAIDFTGDHFDVATVDRLDLDAGNVPSNLTATQRISLRSENDTIALTGVTLDAPFLRLRAGTDLAAGTATLISPNTIEIDVGTDIVVGTIVAGGLDDGSESSTFAAPGNFLVDSLTYGGAVDMRISAEGDLSLGFADPGGQAIDLAAGDALFLGSTESDSGAIRLQGESVTFNNLVSSGLVYVTAGAGGISGLSVGFPVIDTTGGIALESTGDVTISNVFADGDIAISGATVLTSLLSAGGSLAVDAQGAGSVGSFESGGSTVFSGASFDVGGGYAGDFLAIQATDGDLNFGTLGAAGDGTLHASGGLFGGDVGVGGALSLSADVMLIGSAEAAAGIDATIVGDASFTALSSSAGAITLTAGGDVNTGTIIDAATDVSIFGGQFDVANVSAGENLLVDAFGLEATTLSAGGDMSLTLESGAGIGTATAGGDLTLSAGNGLGAQSLTAGNALTVISESPAGIGEAIAGSDLTIIGGLMDVTSLVAGGAIAIDATAGATIAEAVAGGSFTFAGGSLTAGSLDAGTTLNVEVALTAAIDSFSSGSDAFIFGRALDLGHGSVGGNLLALAVEGDLSFADVGVDGDASLSASGSLLGGDIAAGGMLTLFGANAAIGDAAGDAGLSLETAGDVSFASLSSSDGDVAVGAGGAVNGGDIVAGTSAMLTGTDIVLGTATTGTDLALDAANLSASNLDAGAALTVTVGGTGAIDGFASGSDAALSGASLALGTGNVGGDLSASANAGDLAFAALTAAGDSALSASATLSGGNASSGGTLTLSGSSLAIGTGAGGAGVAATTPGAASFTALASSGGAISLDAGGAVSGGSAQAAGGVTLAGASVALNSASFGSGLSLTARTGALSGNGLYLGSGAVSLQAAQGIAIGSADTLGGITMTAGVEARFVELRSRDGAVGVNAGGAIVGSSVAATGSDAAGDDSVLLTTGGAITLDGAVTTLNSASRAQDDFTAQAGGALTIVRAEAGRDLAFTAGAGTLSAADVTSGRDLSLTGPAVQLASGSVARNLSVQATGGDITGSGSATAGGSVDLNASGNIAVGALAADGGSLAASAGGSVGFTNLGATGSLGVVAGGAVSGGTVSAGGSASIRADGAVALSGLTASNATLRSTSSAVSATGIAVSETLDARGTAVTLAAPGALQVNARATAGNLGITTGGNLTVSATATGDVALASTGGSVIIGSVGQSEGNGGGIGAEAVSGGGAVSVSAANAISVADSLTAGGALTMTAGGLVSLAGSANGQTIALTAADLAIGASGSLGSASTQRISLASSAPVNLGSGANSGFAVDAAEFGRIRSAGDLLVTALGGGEGGSSLTVGSLTVNAGSGGQIGAEGTFGLTTSGVLDVNNTLSIAGGGGDNTLMLSGDVVDLDYANAALSVMNASNAPTGRIIVNGRLITSLSAAAAADIVGKTPAEINQRLGLADVVREIGLFRTGRLTLEGRDAILIQNSGGATFDERRGLNVGALTVTGAADGHTLVVINGIINNTTGITAAQNVILTNGLGAGSSVNGCLLANIAACFATGEPEPPLILAPDSIKFGTTDLIKQEEEDDEIEDGVADGKPEAPPIDTTQIDDPAGLPMIDDPVTGAGNEDLWQPPEG